MKPSRQLLFLILIFSFSSGFSFQFSTPSDAIDVKHYSFRVALNDSTDIIEGTAEILFSAKKNLTEFEVDLINQNSQGKGMQVRALTWNEKPLKFIHQQDRIKITLNDQFVAGTQQTIIIIYSGIPQDGLIISKNKYGDRTFFADNWPNRGRHWLPVVDHPADKASVEFIVVAPLHYETVANGIKVEESFLNSRQKLTRYQEDAEISTKVMVIGVARFAVQQAGIVHNIPIESWVYPQNREEGFYDYALAVKIFDFFDSNIGPYSYKKLANVQSKTTFGGLENASAIFYFENSVTGKRAHEMLIAHEIAHQWFGDSATEKDWHHVWLSEGFATYFALLFTESAHGILKRQEEMKTDRDQVIAYYKKNPSPVIDTAVTDLMKLLNPNAYQKASWVLHMLRKDIGDERFWKGIREYYRQFQNGNALTSDFQEVMENASGKNLDPFFDQWIYKAGHPVLEGEWKYDEPSKTLKISLKQVQKTTLFSFPLEIGIFIPGKDSPQIHRIYINKESQEISIRQTAKPSKIELDPDINLLFEGKLRN